MLVSCLIEGYFFFLEGNGLYIRLGENDDASLVIPEVRDQLVGGLRVNGLGAATTGNAAGEALCFTADANGACGAAEESRGKAKERNGLHRDENERIGTSREG